MVTDWYIVFSRRGEGAERFWTRPLRRGWKHCWMFGLDREAGVWVALNPCFNALGVEAFDARRAEWWIATARRGCVPILHHALTDSGPQRPRPMVLTCASVLAWALGMAKSPLTPRALYRQLLRAGAAPIVATE